MPVEPALETYGLCGSPGAVTLLDAWPWTLPRHPGPVGRPAPAWGPACSKPQALCPSGGLESRTPLGSLAGAEARRACRECWWGVGRRHTVFASSRGSQLTQDFGMDFVILVLSQSLVRFRHYRQLT